SSSRRAVPLPRSCEGVIMSTRSRSHCPSVQATACCWARWGACAGSVVATAAWSLVGRLARVPRPSRRLIKRKENRMETPAVASLRAQAEPLAALSISHLSQSTRLKLADDDLSVNAYPTDCGGL